MSNLICALVVLALAFGVGAVAPAESWPGLIAAGPKAPVKGKSKGKWVSAKNLKTKRDKKTAAKVAAKSKKPVAKNSSKSNKGRKIASVVKKHKKAK